MAAIEGWLNHTGQGMAARERWPDHITPGYKSAAQGL